MPRMVRVIHEMPSQIEVRSFYAETLCILFYSYPYSSSCS